MTSMVFLPCPRCGGMIENEDGMQFSSGSRATPDRDIDICAPCGSDEALRAHAEGWIVPVSEWPMRNDGEILFGPLNAHHFHDELARSVLDDSAP